MGSFLALALSAAPSLAAPAPDASSPSPPASRTGAPNLQAAPPVDSDLVSPTNELSPDDLGAADTGAAAPGPAVPPPSRFNVVWSGAVDFGFFVPSGRGAGWIQDEGPVRAFPGDAGRYSWVFLGDIYSTAVNSRGEPADLGDTPGVVRTDSVDSNGAAGFIVNEANLIATTAVGDHVLGTVSANIVPRSGFNFSRGDSIELDLAQVEWLPTVSQKTSVFVGKMESVVGIEYRDRKSAQRFGITPSLIARYTTGTPLGLKIIHKIGDRRQLVLAVAVTNGSSVVEPFHFADEVDSNDGKTASGRIAGRLRQGQLELEVGASGSYGAQDRALDSRYPLWFAGFDLLARFGALQVKAQWLTGRGKGQTDQTDPENHRPYGLLLRQGAYLEADAMVTPWLGFLARGELRDARVWLGNPDAVGGGERLYITKSWRATAGVRIVISAQAVVKAEYLRNGEYGGVPTIDNDVFTSSFVWTF